MLSVVCVFTLVPQAQSAVAAEAVKVAAVTASGFESKAHGGFKDFPPENTVDGKLIADSSWRAEVNDPEKGQWIQYDLGEEKKLECVKIAFVSGHKRIYRFKIEGSADGEKWTELFSGASGGQTAELETFDAGGASARYIRLTGFGNTNVNPAEENRFLKWFNIVETQIYVRD